METALLKNINIISNKPFFFLTTTLFFKNAAQRDRVYTQIYRVRGTKTVSSQKFPWKQGSLLLHTHTHTRIEMSKYFYHLKIINS